MRDWRWQAPPGWPVPPQGWAPATDWQPDPSWPPAPANWQWWAPPRPWWTQRTPAVVAASVVATALLFTGAVTLGASSWPGAAPAWPRWWGDALSGTAVVTGLSLLVPGGGTHPDLGTGAAPRRERRRALARQLRGRAPRDPADDHPRWQLAVSWTTQTSILLLGGACACGVASTATSGLHDPWNLPGALVVAFYLAIGPVVVSRALAGSRYLAERAPRPPVLTAPARRRPAR